MWRAGALVLVLLAACASGSGSQISVAALKSTPLTQLVDGGTFKPTYAPPIIWYIWNDLQDPDSKLSVESRIQRAKLNAGGWTCRDYNARGHHLTNGLFAELGSLATGEVTTPNGGCVSSDRPGVELTAEIRDLGGVSHERVASVATRIGFTCPQPVGPELRCTAEYVERETVTQPPEVVRAGGKARFERDYMRTAVLTYQTGGVADVEITRVIVP